MLRSRGDAYARFRARRHTKTTSTHFGRSHESRLIHRRHCTGVAGHGCATGLGASADQAALPGGVPPSSLTFENFKFWAERVKALSGGRLLIETLPPGAVVPAFEVLDAVHKGVIDGGHTAAAYWVGKNRAATLFGPAPGGPFGMDMLDYMGWL
jgi:TRAP-type mannitol/chloroaromatic compound transport system substrate-binding protein